MLTLVEGYVNRATLAAGILIAVIAAIGALEPASAQEPTEKARPVTPVTVSTEATPGIPVSRLTGGSLTVMADGVQCATELATDRNRFVILVGGPQQPPECSRAGATLSFVPESGIPFGNTLVLTPGAELLLSNFAPGPSDAGDASIALIDQDAPWDPGWAFGLLALVVVLLLVGASRSAVGPYHRP